MSTTFSRLVRLAGLFLAACSVPALAAPAVADPAWSLSATYKGDIAGVDGGPGARGSRYLDAFDISGEADLGRLAGWQGATIRVDLLSSLGGRPNDLARTLQGVDNIEVASRGVRLYQALIEQKLAGGAVALLAGLYDVNADFYASESAGLLIAPAFGMGSELSATGPNGPSTFPSTALGVRGRLTVGDSYIPAAAVNAQAGTLGDERGLRFSGRDGALLLAEAGWTGSGKVAIGAWAYTRRQPVVVPPGISQGEGLNVSHGAYLLLEHGLAGAEGGVRHMRGFLRAGVSDGRTTPFGGGVQAGLLLDRVFAERPDSAFSAGYSLGGLSSAYRAANPGDVALAQRESGFELTYSDCVRSWLCIQPDVQYVTDREGERDAHDVLVAILRVTLSFDLH